MNKKDCFEGMNNFQISRWAALMEGVNIIMDMAEANNTNPDDIELKPIALKKYIDSTCDIICRKMNEAEENENIRKANNEKR